MRTHSGIFGGKAYHHVVFTPIWKEGEAVEEVGHVRYVPVNLLDQDGPVTITPVSYTHLTLPTKA